MENTPRSGMRRARRLIKPPTAEKPGKRRRQSEPNLTRKKNERRRSNSRQQVRPKGAKHGVQSEIRNKTTAVEFGCCSNFIGRKRSPVCRAARQTCRERS